MTCSALSLNKCSVAGSSVLTTLCCSIGDRPIVLHNVRCHVRCQFYSTVVVFQGINTPLRYLCNKLKFIHQFTTSLNRLKREFLFGSGLTLSKYSIFASLNSTSNRVRISCTVVNTFQLGAFIHNMFGVVILPQSCSQAAVLNSRHWSSVSTTKAGRCRRILR